MDNLSVTQRRWLAENMKDCLVNLEVQDEPYFRRLGPSVQAVMRESVQFTCLHKPLKGKETVEKYEDNEEEKTREFITYQIVLYQPGTNDKIILERRFTKALVETK